MRTDLKCPTCGHDLDADTGKKQRLILWCWICEGKNRVELAKLASELSHDPNHVHKVNVTTQPRKVWTEEQLKTTLTIARQNLLKDAGAQEFLAARGIPLVLAQAFALGCGEFYGCNRIVIPYTDGAWGENVLQLRYRRLRESKNKVGKWAAQKRLLGGRRLFNLPTLLNWSPEDTNPVIITESELDAMMLAGLDVQAISVDGAGHRLLEPDLILLRRVKNLILAFDCDEAGAKCTARFKELLPAARVLGGYGKDGIKDIGELHRDMGAAAFKARLERFLNQSRRTA